MSQADNVRLMKVEAEMVRMAAAITELRGLLAEAQSKIDALQRAVAGPQPERKRA